MTKAEVDLEQAMDVARRVVEAASAAALKHFRRGVVVERKVDRSPVTVADREAEAAMLEIVRAAFPEHAVLGEETGKHGGDQAWRWILDPVDGTHPFTRGMPSWGPLCALEHQGRVVAGAAALPVLGESYWAARGHGAWMNGARLQVSGVEEIKESTVCLGYLDILTLPQHVNGTLSVMREAWTCVPGDLSGGLWVLSGRADAWIDAGLEVWDIAPFQILLEEAGGRFTDLEGRETVHSGSVLATNGKLHDALLARMRGRDLER